MSNLDTRHKKLIFRSWHRGTREMDLILGRFAERHVPHLTAEQLDQYEELLKEQDPDIYDWITGRADLPEYISTELVELFKLEERLINQPN